MTQEHRFIYLASQRPRRRQLLEQLGVCHELLLPNAAGDEAERAYRTIMEAEPWAPKRAKK